MIRVIKMTQEEMDEYDKAIEAEIGGTQEEWLEMIRKQYESLKTNRVKREARGENDKRKSK